jgi:hypothetical protein
MSFLWQWQKQKNDSMDEGLGLSCKKDISLQNPDILKHIMFKGKTHA